MRQAALDTKYVALSYVWGNFPMFRLQKDNFEMLSTEGSLDAIRNELPKTINDALDLVREMGLRYLWVDSLCLVQDDEDDVSLGIEQMNSIYQGSHFTIVAASGTHAGAGIPGIGSTPRGIHQITKNVSPNLEMSILYSIDWHLKRSTHHRRGWTLQELVLPRRAVIFIDNQAYFRCQEVNWGEGSWADKRTHWLDADDSNISRIPDPNDGFLPSFWAYQKLCEDYSRRQLRSDGDALRAISGISRPLASGMETLMVEGLPGYYLDHFMLFISSDGNMRRRTGFASFSWAGWEGGIVWPRENYMWRDDSSGEQTWNPTNIVNWFKYKRVVQWNALKPSGSLEHLSSFRGGEMPSLLVELMRLYPNAFPTADVDPQRQHDAFPKYSSSGSYNSDIPDWDQRRHDVLGEDEDDADLKLKPRRPFSVKGLNLANGQTEFERLVGRLKLTGESPLETKSIMNWMAGRYFSMSLQHIDVHSVYVPPRENTVDIFLSYPKGEAEWIKQRTSLGR